MFINAICTGPLNPMFLNQELTSNKRSPSQWAVNNLTYSSEIQWFCLQMSCVWIDEFYKDTKNEMILLWETPLQNK